MAHQMMPIVLPGCVIEIIRTDCSLDYHAVQIIGVIANRLCCPYAIVFRS